MDKRPERSNMRAFLQHVSTASGLRWFCSVHGKKARAGAQKSKTSPVVRAHSTRERGWSEVQTNSLKGATCRLQCSGRTGQTSTTLPDKGDKSAAALLASVILSPPCGER